MKWLFSIHWVLVAAVWYFGNGILHDVFVLLNHKGNYDSIILIIVSIKAMNSFPNIYEIMQKYK
jgi:hypothetical protein